MRRIQEGCRLRCVKDHLLSLFTIFLSVFFFFSRGSKMKVYCRVVDSNIGINGIVRTAL